MVAVWPFIYAADLAVDRTAAKTAHITLMGGDILDLRSSLLQSSSGPGCPRTRSWADFS